MSARPLLITGGSRGIGAATAWLAALRGQPVAIVYRDRADAAQTLVARIHTAGGRAIALQADVAVERDVERVFEQARDRLGPIGALVNNAGITGGAATLQALTASQLAQLFAVNVAGAFLCAREAAAQMRLEGGGAIVNVSSRAACGGAPGVWVHYAASKGALDTMTLGLARELAPAGIRVNGVRPGVIDTEIHEQRPAGALDALVATLPLGRIGRADEVAAAILWLLSAEASYVSGSVLDVAGAA